MKVERKRELAPGAIISEGKVHIGITTKGLRNILPSLENTIVFGNMCYSGWNAETNRAGFPLGNGFTGSMRSTVLGKNPISYYAFAAGGETDYSYNVPNQFARNVQTLLIDRLVHQTDCSQDAALYEDGTTPFVPFNPQVLQTVINVGALLFNHYGRDGYGYNDCGTFRDPRDQEVYRLACIGDQVWFAENLRYEVEGSLEVEWASHPELRLGRLYDSEMVAGDDAPWTGWMEGDAPIRGICPEGWHVPSRQDFAKLFEAISYPYQPLDPPVHCDEGVTWTTPRDVYIDHFNAIMLMGEEWYHEPASVFDHPDLNVLSLDLLPSGRTFSETTPGGVGGIGAYWASSRIYSPFSYDATHCVYDTYEFSPDNNGFTYMTINVNGGTYRMGFELGNNAKVACRCVKD